MKKLMKTTNETTLRKALGRRSLGKVGMILGGVLVLSGAIVQADTFGTGANGFTLDFVPIGNAGNGNDAGAGGGSYFSPYGGVSYKYRMGTYEIPQSAIDKAAMSGLNGMPTGSWSGEQPSANITWFQMASFVNWLNTSTGHHKAYILNDRLSKMTPWSTESAWQEGGENLFRHKDSYYFLPSENEWYKAAYHKNDGVTNNYYDYATASNYAPVDAVGTDESYAVYAYTTTTPVSVNNSGGLSAYGTRGQGGNISEMLESVYSDFGNYNPDENRVIRGGDWYDGVASLRSSSRDSFSLWWNGSGSNLTLGFRVASVPEPSAAMLMISAGMLALARRRTRAVL